MSPIQKGHHPMMRWTAFFSLLVGVAPLSAEGQHVDFVNFVGAQGARAEFVLDVQRRNLHYRIGTNVFFSATVLVHNGAIVTTLHNGSGSYAPYVEGSKTVTPAVAAALFSGSVGYGHKAIPFPTPPSVASLIVPRSARRFQASLTGGGARVTLFPEERRLTILASATPSGRLVIESARGSSVTTIADLGLGAGRWSGAAENMSSTPVNDLLAGAGRVRILDAFTGKPLATGGLSILPSGFALYADASGVVPPSPPGASGHGTFSFDPANGILTYDLTSSGLTAPPTAQLGIAAPYVALTGGRTLTRVGSRWQGKLTLTSAERAALFDGTLTVKCLGARLGEAIRGQIRSNPELFGLDSSGRLGGRLGIDLAGTGKLGTPATFSLRNASPNVSAALFFAFSNTTWFGMPIPNDMHSGGFNFTRCWNWLDSAGAGFAAAYRITDAGGGATFSTTVPGVPALAGFRIYAQWLVASGGAPAAFGVTEGLRLTLH